MVMTATMKNDAAFEPVHYRYPFLLLGAFESAWANRIIIAFKVGFRCIGDGLALESTSFVYTVSLSASNYRRQRV